MLTCWYWNCGSEQNKLDLAQLKHSSSQTNDAGSKGGSYW